MFSNNKKAATLSTAIPRPTIPIFTRQSADDNNNTKKRSNAAVIIPRIPIFTQRQPDTTSLLRNKDVDNANSNNNTTSFATAAPSTGAEVVVHEAQGNDETQQQYISGAGEEVELSLVVSDPSNSNNNSTAGVATTATAEAEAENIAATLVQARWRGMKTRSDIKSVSVVPILIIPAISGSGLKIEKSALGKRYEGGRVWMNPTMLTTSRILNSRVLSREEVLPPTSLRNTTLQLQQQKPPANHGDNDNNNNISNDESSTISNVSNTSSFVECESAFQVRSAWLHHMSLCASDMVSERPGNRIRPYEGLAGVEYITGDTLTQLGSWVQAPVTKYLTESLGYERGRNLDAAPYDWRLPPCVTEERDNYLTKTKHRIEQMYHDNYHQPVMLLCHSMGCKMGHYFLNWVKLNDPNNGQAWLDKYIHSYVAVGAPHCGVSLAVQAGLIGKGLSPEVDMMMADDDEGLVLYRSWGSGAWLMPRILPPHVIPSIICRREGELVVAIQGPIEFGTLFQSRKQPKELRLGICFRNIVAMSPYQKVTLDQKSINFGEHSFYFAVPNINNNENEEFLGSLRFFLEEPGGLLQLDKSNQNDIRVRLSKATNWAPFKAVKRGIINMSRELSKSSGGIGNTKAGYCDGGYLKVSDFLHHSERTIEKDLSMFHPTHLGHASGRFHIVLKYNPPRIAKNETDTPIAAITHQNQNQNHYNHNDDTNNNNNNMCTAAPIQNTEDSAQDVDNKVTYDVLSGHQIFEMEGFTNVSELVRERYEKDPVGPRTLSATEAPPVKCMRAIYGVNVNTEVCAVYKHRPYFVVGDDKADSRFVLDTETKLVLENNNTNITHNTTTNNNNNWNWNNNYYFNKGKLYETCTTLQQTVDENGNIVHIQRCGDGTVPYWNLAQCKKWSLQLQELSVDELDGAGHRDILADQRFHNLLQKYCCVDKSKSKRRLIRMYSSSRSRSRSRVGDCDFPSTLSELSSD